MAAASAGAVWEPMGDALLVELVDEALQRNLGLDSARAAVHRARALRELAAAGRGPMLSAGGSAGRLRSGGREADSLRVGLDASWEADFFGAQSASLAAAGADEASAVASLEAARLAVAAETAIAYLQWQGIRAQRVVAEASLSNQQQTLDLLELRVRTGLSGDLERQQAEAGMEQSRARRAALGQQQRAAEHALAVLLGRPAGALADRLAAAPAAVPAPPPLPGLPLPVELLQRRWDLQAAEQRIASQLATLQQRRAERLPRFTIGGNLALQAATLAALGTPGALLAGVTAAIDLTLVDGGAGLARVQAQQAAVDAARADWRQAVLVALQDVEDGLVALEHSRERTQALQRASAAADEALRLARIGWRAGLQDFVALLDGERSALNAADALAAARSDHAVAFVRLYKSLGGPWPAAGTHSTARTP